MSWDIYGNPLRRGYCEVHPDVHQEYPCSICMAQNQQQSQPHNELEQLQYEFAQQGDYIRQLESERAALAARADSLLDNCKAFVKKEFELLKEVERLEIELKKRDEQNAALAAQVEELLVHGTALATAASMATGAMAIGSPVTEFCVEAVKRFNAAKAVTPQHHLAEIRAEAVLDAVKFFAPALDIETESLEWYAAKVRQGGAA